MVASRIPGPIGRSGTVEYLRDGTSIRDLSPHRGPLGIGVSSPDRTQSDSLYSSSVEWLFQRLRLVATGEELQRITVTLLGPQCFSAGVIAGIGVDIVTSVVDLLKLAGKFVLADLHDLETVNLPWWRYANLTVAPRLLLAKLAGSFFGSELRQAAEERDAIIKELTKAFEDPKTFFAGVADNVIAGYQKDWADFKTHMAAGTLEGRFRAGMILGKLLIVVLGLLAGVVGAARVGAKVASQLPRLVEHARAFRIRRGAAPTGRATGEARTPSQVREQSGTTKPGTEKPTSAVSARDRELAKSTGTSAEIIAARKNVVTDFYERNGMSNKLNDELPGIDMTKPVEFVSFPPPETMSQFVREGGKPGRFFDPVGGQSPGSLGIDGTGRVPMTFKTPPGEGLKSTAAPIVDSWTNPANPVSTLGGGTQIVVGFDTLGTFTP